MFPPIDFSGHTQNITSRAHNLGIIIYGKFREKGIKGKLRENRRKRERERESKRKLNVKGSKLHVQGIRIANE